MDAQLPKHALVLLVFVSMMTAGCSDENDVGLTAPTVINSLLVSAEPSTVTPEVLVTPLCSTGSPFGLRIVITIDGGRAVILRALRFTFFDRFGGTAVPVAVSPLSPAVPSSSPIPNPASVTFPSSSPIPIPDSATGGVLIPAGVRRTFPFFLEFGCDVRSAGTLVATIETDDDRSETTEVRIQVGK